MSTIINVVVMVHFISPTSKLYLVSSPKKFKVFLKELVTCRQGLYDTSASLFLFYGDKNSLVPAGSFVLAIGPTTRPTSCMLTCGFSKAWEHNL